jgi:hypothetical protein
MEVRTMTNDLMDLAECLANRYGKDGNQWEITSAEKSGDGWQLTVKRLCAESEGAENASDQ